jgi:phenylpropionate dioxygenase-like ring-hydroxylating dioxygenase large terminal subunit
MAEELSTFESPGMNDLVRHSHLLATRPQLPVQAYFDEALFQREMAMFERQAMRYVGHRQWVPEQGDWRTLAHEDNARVLVHGRNGVQLMSNVCRHRQALILGGAPGAVAAGPVQGRLPLQAGGHIVCPLHRWTYSDSGELVGAPHFAPQPCTHLPRYPLKACQGSFFEGPGDPARDLAGLFERPAFDFSGYVLDRVEIQTCRYNWKTFIEVYLEDYHVGPFHPGLGSFVTCDDLDWTFAPSYSVQRVGVHRGLESPGSPVYRAWHERLLQHRGGVPPSFGAIWVTYYPTHMIEIYPHAVVRSTLYPRGPQETLNVVEFCYPEDIQAFEREFVEAHQAAYKETVVEDDEIAERMDAGRRALWRRGITDAGPYQSPMEDGMRHFHQWYRQAMDFQGAERA